MIRWPAFLSLALTSPPTILSPALATQRAPRQIPQDPTGCSLCGYTQSARSVWGRMV